MLSNITPLYFFNSNIIYFAQKEPIKVKNFETLEYSGKNLTNSSYQFWNNKSIPLQILHHSSVSWKITPLYVFISNSINFAQKWPIKVNIFKNTCILYWEKLDAYLPLYFLTALQMFEKKRAVERQKMVCLILCNKTFPYVAFEISVSPGVFNDLLNKT